MAKFFQRPNGEMGCCVTEEDERRYLPADATVTATCDETVPANMAIIDEYRANPTRFTFVAGQLRRDGVAVVFAADSVERSNLAGFRSEATQAITDNQTYLALGNPTNAQNLALMRALTRQMNRVLRLFLVLDSKRML